MQTEFGVHPGEWQKPVQAYAGDSFVRLLLLIFSDDDKYARAAAGKDLIAPAKDLSKSRLSITCVLHAPVPHCTVLIS